MALFCICKRMRSRKVSNFSYIFWLLLVVVSVIFSQCYAKYQNVYSWPTLPVIVESCHWITTDSTFMYVPTDTILTASDTLRYSTTNLNGLWITPGFCGGFSSVQFSSVQFSSIQFSSLQLSSLTGWVVEETWQTIQQRSSSSLFCRRPLWAVLAWAGMSTLWCCPSSISSADYGVAHLPRCPEGWFWRGCGGVWHDWTMQVSVSWR